MSANHTTPELLSFLSEEPPEVLLLALAVECGIHAPRGWEAEHDEDGTYISWTTEDGNVCVWRETHSEWGWHVYGRDGNCAAEGESRIGIFAIQDALEAYTNLAPELIDLVPEQREVTHAA